MTLYILLKNVTEFLPREIKKDVETTRMKTEIFSADAGVELAINWLGVED